MAWAKRLTAILLAFGISSALGQMPNKPVPKGADYYEILDLNARFCHGLDNGTDAGRQFAAAFTPEGAYIDASGKETRGADQLAAMARELPRRSEINPQHYVVNIRLELVPGGAHQWSYILITGPSQPGQPDAVIDGGQYWDDLVKTSQGWRIAKRTLIKPGTTRPDDATFFTQAQPVSAKFTDKSGLTPNDRAEIFQLYAHYPYALDEILEGGQMFANLFTPDGVMVNADGTTVAGRAMLAEFAWKRGLTDDKTYITNVMLEQTPAGVNAKAYVMNAHIPQMPAPSTISPAGMFFDQLVKTSEGWRFRRKVLIAPDGIVPGPSPAGPRFTTPSVISKAKQQWALTADDYARSNNSTAAMVRVTTARSKTARCTSASSVKPGASPINTTKSSMASRHSTKLTRTAVPANPIQSH